MWNTSPGSGELPSVSVIMPTRALARRRSLLWRALDSVLSQEAVRVVPILVINGPDRDPELTRELSANRSFRVARLEDADLPAALRQGRAMVDTPWFAELDDDDLLLPGALALRAQVLRDSGDVDAVITNGFRRTSTGDVPSIDDATAVERDPLRALVMQRKNWLLPGSWLCRTERVGAEFFEHMPKFRECTYLALRLAATRTIRFLNHPTVVWHAETPLSESKSPAYALAGAAAARRYLALDLPPDVRAILRKRVAPACHANVRFYLKGRRFQSACSWHLQSLRAPGGWRYLAFTPYLLYAALRH